MTISIQLTCRLPMVYASYRPLALCLVPSLCHAGQTGRSSALTACAAYRETMTGRTRRQANRTGNKKGHALACDRIHNDHLTVSPAPPKLPPSPIRGPARREGS